jgi:DNA-binding XRE family transcriptional regulator
MAENSRPTHDKHPGKRGRPSKFTPAMLKQARFLAEKGCTDVEMAGFFEVSEKTLNTWKKEYPDFLESLKAGKAIADDKVQNALFQRAIGFSYPDTHVSNHQGTVTLTPIVKHLPPETTAAIFWLKNRRPAEWRDKVDVNANHVGDFHVVIGSNV